MNAVRIRKKIESDTINLPELRPMIGREVEIIVLDDQPAPPVDERLPDVGKLRALATGIDFDYEAFERLREISKL